MDVRNLIVQSADQIADGFLLGTSTHTYPPGHVAIPHQVGRVNALHAILAGRPSQGIPPAQNLFFHTTKGTSYADLDAFAGPIIINSDVNDVLLTIKIANVTGCKMSDGKLMSEAVPWSFPDEYYFDYGSPTVGVYSYSITCTTIWGATVPTLSGTFTVVPSIVPVPTTMSLSFPPGPYNINTTYTFIAHVLDQFNNPMVPLPQINWNVFPWWPGSPNISSQGNFSEIYPGDYSIEASIVGTSPAVKASTVLHVSAPAQPFNQTTVAIPVLDLNSVRVHPNPWKSTQGINQMTFDQNAHRKHRQDLYGIRTCGENIKRPIGFGKLGSDNRFGETRRLPDSTCTW